MKTAEIKRRWLDFFEKKGHTVVDSSSLISEDPNLMFVVAGMVPFIPYMTGVMPAPYQRATSVQKCVRTLDIEEVGKTTRHGTFFQMNGNFSFGDYFKKEAIAFAWELLTSSVESGGYGFDAERLWVTVYEDDDEAIRYWLEQTSIPEERIQRRGMRDNYWSTGQRGPAGPCSEIYFDRGPEFGLDGGPVADEDRYLEIWNLVFMQYERADGGTKDHFEILGELPKKNIDTGMGLERVAFILQGVDNIYEIDQVRPLIDEASKMADKTYGSNTADDVRLRVIADHVRSALMLMSDGVSPSNEGRGYVLRRLLRRSVRALRLLGVQEPVLERLFTVSKDAMVEAYPELEGTFSRVLKLAVAEEAGFLRTLESGLQVLEIALQEGTATLSGEVAFQLHDTYGFPIDLTVEIAEEAGVAVDRERFNELMLLQRNRAKADAAAKKVGSAGLQVYADFRKLGETKFVGYESLETESKVLGIVRDGESSAAASVGQLVEVILDSTSLYAESGGQVADAGEIYWDGGRATVLDVQKPVKGLFVHRVQVLHGELCAGAKVHVRVDADWRLGACQAHSGTHVVHAALRQVLGPDALQSGSLNRPGYLRLDFAWNQALSEATKSEIEEVSNLAIRQDLSVQAQFMSLEDARQWGAIALFGETYDESVRVVEVGGPWSRELCGGTHVKRSSQIGLIALTGESSVGSGTRRVEANVGADAWRGLFTARDLLGKIGNDLKVNQSELEARLLADQQKLKQLEKDVARYRLADAMKLVPALRAAAESGSNCKHVVVQVEDVDSEALRPLAVEVLAGLDGAAAVVLFSPSEGKASLLAAANQSAQALGVKAGDLAKSASAVLGGGGGGKADFAQGGGPEVTLIPAAIESVKSQLR